MLVRIRADERRLSDYVDIALPTSSAVEHAAGRGFKDQVGRAIMQLGCGLDTDLEVESGVGVFRDGSLPGLILCTVLRQGGGELADAVGILNVDGDGGRLPDGGRGWDHIQRGLAAAGQSQE